MPAWGAVADGGQEELDLGMGKGERGHPGWLEVSLEVADCLRSY